MTGRSNARKVDKDGYTFDSRAEARRYDELRLLERGGVIRDLVIHPRYELQPAFERDGQRIRAIYYEGDFEYWEGASLIVEDVKGFEFETWKLKRKIFLYQYPSHVLRVTSADRRLRR